MNILKQFEMADIVPYCHACVLNDDDIMVPCAYKTISNERLYNYCNIHQQYNGDADIYHDMGNYQRVWDANVTREFQRQFDHIDTLGAQSDEKYNAVQDLFELICNNKQFPYKHIRLYNSILNTMRGFYNDPTVDNDKLNLVYYFNEIFPDDQIDDNIDDQVVNGN